MRVGVSYKFDEQCNPVPYYGNTIVSYLNDTDSEIFQAAVNVQAEIKKLSLASHLAFLPPDSFHMTVLTLCREIDRNSQYWPPMVPTDARFTEVDRILKDIVQTVPVPENVWMEIDECEITKIVLKPADEQSTQKLLDYRDQVAQATGIRHSWHIGFRYHISLDYLVKPLSPTQLEEKERACRMLTEYLKNTVKPFLMPAPDFVIFNDMMSYETDLSLRGNLY